MMGKYLMGGNVLLPLICVNSQSDECACSTFEQGEAALVNVHLPVASSTTSASKSNCMRN